MEIRFEVGGLNDWWLEKWKIGVMRNAHPVRFIFIRVDTKINPHIVCRHGFLIYPNYKWLEQDVTFCSE